MSAEDHTRAENCVAHGRELVVATRGERLNNVLYDESQQALS